MENLKEMEKAIMKKYSDKLAFFAVKVPIESIADKTVFWIGEDYNEFFDIAVKAGAKIIYYHETFPINKKRIPEHADDISKLELGFMHNGIMHILIAYTDWYDPLL